MCLRSVHRFLLLLTVASLLCLPPLSAQDAAKSASVFPVGKAETGKSLFIQHGCYQCHNAGSTKLPKIDLEPRLVIELGGEHHAKWTRDDFAQAIMNPNHVVAEEYRIAMMRLGDNLKAENSPMPSFWNILRVGDLIQLVTFLDELSN